MQMQEKRFGSKSEEEIDAEISKSTPWNTKKSRDSVWRQFSSFLKEKGYNLEQSTSPESLNTILKSWASNMKKKDGTDYKENVIKHMFNTTAKLVQEKYFNEWNIKINPFTDPCFKAARDARDATRRKLQTLPEKRTVNSAALTENEFLNMVQILNENTPDGLQKKFFLIASFELAWRGGEGASCFTYYFKPEIDNKGLTTGRIEYNPVFSKTAQGGSKPLTSSKWLTKNKDNPNLCPVRLYHLLMMKRRNNINTDRMFLTPNPFWNKIQNAVWYKNSPVGVNEIGKWVKSLAIVTGLDIKRRKISNHSVRSSAVSALAKAGVEEQQLMKITGHQNVNSIKPYLQLDDEHHKSIINKIRNNSVNHKDLTDQMSKIRNGIRSDINEIKDEIKNMKREIKNNREEVKQIATDIDEMKIETAKKKRIYLSEYRQ
ncbi:hypothetical protein Zmor_024416 [Zophobas morio]|uniref:Tyr recombinase domain-containing protein n=1 Tax=Zophobas morio TaxID=2755281 RepID=A0AA38I092_9CUCU|nr:hypothetical protein Zmor_024416 [Zophobas morio]